MSKELEVFIDRDDRLQQQLNMKSKVDELLMNNKQTIEKSLGQLNLGNLMKSTKNKSTCEMSGNKFI